jgi:hypothetical protein
MARQIFNKSFCFHTPELNGYINKDGEKIKFKITVQKKVTLDKIEIEKQILKISVDVFGYINNYPFIIYFTHPDRIAPVELSYPIDQKYGAISIELDRLYSLFSKEAKSKNRYKQILKDFLINDIKSKKWLYHPRTKHCKDNAKKALKEKARNDIQLYNDKLSYPFSPVELEPLNIPKVTIPNRYAYYQCVQCKSEWEGFERTENRCKICNTHLFTRVKKYKE